MDKKIVKTDKDVIQNNDGRKEAEMFVLTPDILEKLGIHLGQFKSPSTHPGTSNAPEAPKAKHKSGKKGISNPAVTNGDLSTKSKVKTSKVVIAKSFPNAEDNINQSDNVNKPSELLKLLQRESVFPNVPYKGVSGEQGSSITNNLIPIPEVSQATKCSSSILETASLMKKSVLLSPTFCNSDYNPNTCDQIPEFKESSVVPVTLICTKNVNKHSEPLSNADTESPSYGEIWPAQLNIVNQPKEGTNDLDQNPVTLQESTITVDNVDRETSKPEITEAFSGPSQNINTIDTVDARDSNIKTNNIVEEFTFSTKYHESNNNDNFIRPTVSSECSQNKVISTLDDHLDEIYSSDASNQEIKSKIKIISEQILNPVQLMQIKNANVSHKSNYMPVSVETLIRKTPESGELINNLSLYTENEVQYIKNEYNNLNVIDETNNVIATEKPIEPEKELFILNSKENVAISTPIGAKSDSKKTEKSTTFNRKTYDKTKKSINESIPNLHSSCTDNADYSGNSKSAVTEDKVKEIATYLCQLANAKLLSNKRIYKCYKRHPNKSKLVSQGVEEPGGKIKINRHSVDETTLLSQESLISVKMDSWISTDDIICIGTTSGIHDLTEQLCVCFDFGKLDYYNFDDIYENIHFWCHKKDVCEPEVCFSIYNEGKVSSYLEDDIQILNTPRASSVDDLKSVEKSEVIMILEEDTSSSKPSNLRMSKKNTTKVDIQMLEDSDIIVNNPNAIEESDRTNEDAPCESILSTSVTDSLSKRGRGRPKKNTTRNDIEMINDCDVINNPNSVEGFEVSFANASCGSTLNTPVTDPPAKRGRGRPKKNITKENIDDSDILINNLNSVEKPKVTNEDRSSVSIMNTPIVDKPAKRGRGRPKRISNKMETYSTITDRNSSRLSSTSSYDEPLIPRRVDRLSIKEEQSNHVPLGCIVSGDVDSILNSSVTNHNSRCAICKEEVTNGNWFNHIKIHNYFAWRETEPALDLDDEYEVIRHLTYITKEQNIKLACSKCQKQYKTPKSYYGHVQSCGTDILKVNTSTASDLNTTQESTADKDCETTRKKRKRIIDEIVECGVCHETVKNVDWIEHIRVKHNYLAKRAGEIPLDENDEEAVNDHLYKIAKYHDGLICNKCGLKRKYLKSYFTHIAACKGPVEEVKEPEPLKIDIECDDPVKCGVCKIDVHSKLWVDHIEKAHKYLAWIEGQPPLNMDDPEQLYDHYQSVARTAGFLRCWVCSEKRKIVKIFLQHVKLCELSGFEKLEPVEKNPNIDEDHFECGVCHEIGFMTQWKLHAMLKHYNVAWMVGQMPINLKNFYAVEKYLKEYKANNNLVCNVCGETRVSCYGFYAHVIICGKSEAELEDLQNVCEICNKKYVCVYKNQHMASHRVSELMKEKRERDAAEAYERERQREIEENTPFEPGRKRKAAERASKVIQNLKQEDDAGPSSAKRIRYDSEDSVKMESEGESSDDVEVDSNVSDEANEENEPKKGKRKRNNAPKIRRISFKVLHFTTFLKKSYKDFCEYHFTNDCLFNDWRHTDIQLVSKSASQYLPTVTESCRFKYGDNDWTSYKRFEAAKIGRGIVLYAGGCIQCLSWAPQPPGAAGAAGAAGGALHVALAAHRGPDVPRFDKDSTPAHPGFIQIWSLTDFGVLPVFSLGLAHDYGTIWAMDWCPSGARDVVPRHEENVSRYRLGLLAVACSNGFAYILSVPYPDVNRSEVKICKANTLVEMRLHMNSGKQIYQATSIAWSTQRGHSTIVVGYADGTTALYDLSTKSPLLTKKENNVTILYPYLDKRTENGPVSGVSVSASMASAAGAGCVCSGSAGGAGVWRARRGATLRSATPAAAVRAAAHWPSYLLYSELAVSSKVVNELEWYGGGRRVGGATAGGVCARCACAVLAAPPALRLVRAHPCYSEPRRPLILATLRMVPLNGKPLIKNDDLTMIIEPITYDDTVTKYGLELRMTLKNKPVHWPEAEQRPERFPLSDVTAVAFCPAERHHHRVAVASHAGLVFILNTADG